MKGKILLYTIAAAALTAAVGVSAFLIYTMGLRTDYKETALQINDVILASRNRTVLRIGDDEAPADEKLVDYYDRFLLDPYTAVYSRKKAEPVDETKILLEFADSTLSFEKLEDGSAILITWTTPEKQKRFCVRSQQSFMALETYGRNYLKKAGTDPE